MTTQHSSPETELARKAVLFREGTRRMFEGQGDRADMWLFELFNFLGDVAEALSIPAQGTISPEYAEVLGKVNDELEEENEDLRNQVARLNAQCVPDGWRLVPYERTQDMLDTVTSSEGCEPWTDKIMRKTYQDMLDAAPPLTSTDGGGA